MSNAETNGHARNPLNDAEYIVGRIAAAAGISRGETIKRLKEECDDLGSNVSEDFNRRGLKPYVFSDEMNKFYEETDAFLFETIIWNRTEAKQAMRSWIEKFLARSLPPNPRILTFGDGLGFDSLHFAQCGATVDYFEVSKRCIDFASDIFSDFDGDVTVLTSSDQVEPESYDAVISLDVLEHIPDPSSVVGFLSSAIRPGGYLISHAPFYFLSSATLTHLKENQRYSGDTLRLYRPHGLRAVDADWFWCPIALRKNNDEPMPKRSLGSRIRLGLSGYLLWYGRFWCTPHVKIAKLISKRTNPWPELDALEIDE